MECLNQYSGLFSLIAAIAAIVIPIIIYFWQKRDAKKARQQELQDEINSMEELNGFSMSQEDRKYYAHKSWLQKQLNKK